MTQSSNGPASEPAEQIDLAAEHVEAMRLMAAWRNGAQPPEEIARRAQHHLERAIRACRERGNFKLGIGIDQILELADHVLVKNLVGDACAWKPEHIARLQQRLLDGHEFVSFGGPMGQPILKRPDGSIYILFRTDP